MSALSSFRVTGHVTHAGQVADVDLVLSQDAGGGSYTTSVGPFNVIWSGGNVYLQASEPFWHTAGAPTAIAEELGTKWVTGLSSAESSDLVNTLNAKTLLERSVESGDVSKGGTTTFNGQSAIVLHLAKGATAYVAASGPTYLLGATLPSGSQDGQITFSDFNTAAVPSAPSGAISLSSL
jgi:hypothetical protein